MIPILISRRRLNNIHSLQVRLVTGSLTLCLIDLCGATKTLDINKQVRTENVNKSHRNFRY